MADKPMEVHSMVGNKRVDAHLHEPILSAADDGRARLSSQAAARRACLTEQEVINRYAD